MKKLEISVNIQIVNHLFKKSVDSALFFRGFIAINMQILLIRELLIIFNGNELAIGIILASWLILEATGSGIIGKLADRIKYPASIYILLQIIISLFMPLSIWLARLTRQTFNITPGEIVSIAPMFLGCLLALLPIALIDGIQFPFGCKLYSSIKNEGAGSIGKVYILEAIGMITGGIIFTYVFLKFFNSFELAFILGMISLASALFLTISSDLKKNLVLRIALIIILAISLFMQVSGKVDLLQKESISRQWNRENVVAYKNSIYGNLTVTKKEKQYTFFSDGVPVVTTPIPNIISIEDFIHFPLLFHPAPKKVLVISAAAGGILNEILKYPIEKIDYAELDPLMIDLINDFPTDLTFNELINKKVHIKFQDGRQFVKNTKEKYDVIFINLDLPSSLQVNRLYTTEFYEETAKILNGKGLLVVKCWGSLVYISEEQRDINASFLETLKKSFKHVRVIPGETNLFIASSGLEIDKIRALDVQNWRKLYKIDTRLLTDFYIEYRLNPYWQTWFQDSLKDAKKDLINKDFTPRGLFYGLGLLYSLISPKTKYFFNIVERLNINILFASILIFCLIFVILKKLKKFRSPPIPLFVGITGFSGIAFQLVVILGFQMVFGYLYYWIGILTSAFMLGLSLGATYINKNLEKIKKDLSIFFILEIAILVFAIVLPLILNLISGLQNLKVSHFILQGIFFTSSIIAGALVGLEFPLANKIYWKKQELISHTGGALYASELIGACLGGILIPIAFIPILGIFKTCLIIAALKLSSLIIIKSFK